MKLLTLNEAAERLAISLSTMRAWVSQRRIEVVKIGRCVRIREEALEAFIQESTIAPKYKNSR